MGWKIASGVVLTSISFICALNFWAVCKIAGYRHRVLNDPEVLDRFLQCLGHGWIASEGDRIRPQTGCHYTSVKQLSQGNQNLAWKTATLFLLAVLVLSGVSYWLCPYFLFADAAFFLVAATTPRTQAMTDCVLDEVYLVVLHLYKWNSETPQDCAAQIAAGIPQLILALEAVRRMDPMRTPGVQASSSPSGTLCPR